jgi:hypothetical protein
LQVAQQAGALSVVAQLLEPQSDFAVHRPAALVSMMEPLLALVAMEASMIVQIQPNQHRRR